MSETYIYLDDECKYYISRTFFSYITAEIMDILVGMLFWTGTKKGKCRKTNIQPIDEKNE